MPSRMSSLPATWLYSDIASTPSRDATARMVTAATPCSSAIAIAARRIRSRSKGRRDRGFPASLRASLAILSSVG